MLLLLAAGLILSSRPDWIVHTTTRAEAAQTTTKNPPAKKSTKKKPVQKKSYCGYPAPPNPAGMSDFCAMQYDLYCRRGVGCNQYGR
jgi:hypothetical protein